MLFEQNRKKGIWSMILVTLVSLVLMCTVVFGFHVMEERDNAVYDTSEYGPGTVNQGTYIEEADTEILDSVTTPAGEECLYLVKGNCHWANRYEKVDKLGYTSSIRYSLEDLALLDSDGLRITRNEIFARHGRMFNDQTLQDYFNGQSWYTARFSPENFDENSLNETEKYNVNLIRSYEINNGMNAELTK